MTALYMCIAMIALATCLLVSISIGYFCYDRNDDKELDVKVITLTLVLYVTALIFAFLMGEK